MENFLNLIADVWNKGFLGIDLGSIISSLAVLLIALLFRGFIISVILNALGKLADSTESKIDDEILDALRRPIGLVPITIAIYVCTLILPLSGLIGDIATNIVKAFVIFTIFSALANSVKPIFEALSTSSWLTASMQMWLERASKFIVWVIGVAIILDIFGIQIGPLVAGLGLFSVAVALGAQDFFKNLISGILIIGEHRFQPGDGLTLGNVFIDCKLSVVAHSDGDIVLHAISDALLGAGGLRDIGYYFPDTDEENKNLSSLKIIEKTLDLLREQCLQPRNIDFVIVCEQPKIGPYVDQIKKSLAVILSIEESFIGVKATTTEKMGVIGDGNGIAVFAIASLRNL